MRNIWIILKKEVIQNLRDRKSMFMLVIFPMVLIFILGTAFSNVFKSTIDLKDITIPYYISGTGEDIKYFTGFLDTIENKMKVNFVKKEEKTAIADTKMRKYSCFIVYDSEAKRIKLYKNNRNFLETGIIEMALKNYVDSFNANSEIAKENPRALQKEIKEEEYVKLSSFDGQKNPSSFDYYAITMITMTICYGAFTGAYALKGEKLGKTSLRLWASPMNKWQLLVGKLLGALTITLIQIVLVLLFSKYLMHSYFGSNLGAVIIVFMSLAMFSITLGLVLSYIIKDTSKLNGIITIAVPFMVFLGGGYAVLPESMDKIAYISPVKWANETIFQLIYKKSWSLFPKTLGICLGLTIAFILVTVIFYKGEEGLNI